MFTIDKNDEIIFAMNIWDYNFNYNGKAILFNIFLFLFAIWKYKSLYTGNVKTKGNYKFLYLLLVVFATFAYGEADFYHYQFHYDMMKHYNYESLAEPIYFWIAQNLPDNYFLWRFSIWGSAALLMIYSLKKIGVHASYAGLLMPIFFWCQFSVTRGALGFCLIINALIYLFNNNNYIKKGLAVAALLASVFLHNSMMAFLLIIPIACLMPFNNKTIKISLIMFPFFYGITILITNNLIDLNILSIGTENLAEGYISKHNSELNILGIAFDLLNFSGQLLMLYLSIKFILSKKKVVDKPIIFLIKYGYILVYISFLFYWQGVSSFISSRFLHASTFPLIVVYSYYMQHHKINKNDRVVMFLLGLYAFYKLLYAMYKWW